MFNSNNYFDFMKGMNNQDFFSNQLKNIPSLDFAAVSQMTKENTDAMTSAGQIMSENYQAMIKRFSDSAQNNANDMAKSLQEAVATGDMESLSASQRRFLQSAIEHNLQNTKETLDISTKSALEVLDIVSSNLKSNLNKSFTAKEKAASKNNKK